MIVRPVLTLKEVASYLHVHRNTVYRMAQRGSIPAFKMGSDWRFNRESIDAWRLAQERLVPSQASDCINAITQLGTELLEIVAWYFAEAFCSPVSFSDLRLFSPDDENAVRSELHRLVMAGLLEMVGDGEQARYSLTPVGLSRVKSARQTTEGNQAGHASFMRTAELVSGLKPGTSDLRMREKTSREIPIGDGDIWTR